MNPMKPKLERKFIKICTEHPNETYLSLPDAPQEGFEYLFSSNNPGFNKLQALKEKFSNLSILKTFLKYMRKILSERKKSYKDIRVYTNELQTTGSISNSNLLVDSYPNQELFETMSNFIMEQYPGEEFTFGFTKLPSELIFKKKAVLFNHVLVVIQEMKKDKIDLAPSVEAGDEVMRVYGRLGKVVNELARWLRDKGIKAQSNHPLGGLVCTPPLAGKAGLGWIGKGGLLITPKFGSRVRIAPIFIQNKIFSYTDTLEHQWIEKYCKTCGLCQRSCPTQAIYTEKKMNIDKVEGIGSMRTCIDRKRCFPYFNKTLGCSICIKVCPFSKGQHIYKKLKKAIMDV